MAFTIQNWGRSSVSANEPSESVTPGGGAAVYWGSMREYNYYSPTDLQATVAASGYFNSVIYDLAVGDIIKVYSSTQGSIISYVVTSVANSTVTVSPVDGALVASGVITSAQVLAGLYANPVLLIGAPGANKMIVVNNAVLSIVYATTQYQNGGAIRFQYDSTIHAGGVNACAATVAAADINGATANNSELLLGAAQAFGLNTTWANLGIYLSCATGEFTNGDSPLHYSISYRIANLVSG